MYYRITMGLSIDGHCVIVMIRQSVLRMLHVIWPPHGGFSKLTKLFHDLSGASWLEVMACGIVKMFPTAKPFMKLSRSKAKFKWPSCDHHTIWNRSLWLSSVALQCELCSAGETEGKGWVIWCSYAWLAIYFLAMAFSVSLEFGVPLVIWSLAQRFSMLLLHIIYWGSCSDVESGFVLMMCLKDCFTKSMLESRLMKMSAQREKKWLATCPKCELALRAPLIIKLLSGWISISRLWNISSPS